MLLELGGQVLEGPPGLVKMAIETGGFNPMGAGGDTKASAPLALIWPRQVTLGVRLEPRFQKERSGRNLCDT